MDYDPREIANEFLIQSKKPLNHMKLQKLVYYAYGWGLALLKEPLFTEGIQAWRYGPVISTVYYEFRRYGNEPISGLAIGHDHNILRLHSGNSEQDQLVRKLVKKVWNAYGKYSAIQLANSTHIEGTPWRQVYTNDGIIKQIDNKLIQDYFNSEERR